jgi:signal transduction histidine kinase/CheY-like chemotaxis protein
MPNSNRTPPRSINQRIIGRTGSGAFPDCFRSLLHCAFMLFASRAIASTHLKNEHNSGTAIGIPAPQISPIAWLATAIAASSTSFALTRVATRRVHSTPTAQNPQFQGNEFGNTIPEALIHAKEAAESANRAKDDFIASLSHELRSPLNPVLLLASEYARSAGLPAQMREDFQVILQNVRLQARLIDDLLDLTRIERGGISISSRMLDLKSVLREVQESLRSEADEKHIYLALNVPAGLCSVRGDNVRLQQIFGNVIRNAIKFSPSHSSVQVTLTTSARTAKVSVTDEGSGIIASDLKTIFEPFTQGGRGAPRGNPPGLGLGLSIARRLVERHRGVISAESDGLGKGATFRIELPLEAPKPAEPQPLPFVDPAPHTHSASLRILLVDDHESTRQILARMIRRLGHQVFDASTVGLAFRILSQNSMDILISDLGLPDGDGTELATAWNHRLRLGSIALSGFGMASDVARSLEGGFSYHLTKPVEFEQLAQTIEELYRKAAANS